MSLILAANAVAILHGTLVIFIVSCTLFSIAGKLHTVKKIRNIYLVTAGAVMTSQLLYGECVLTVLEKRVRVLAVGHAYRNSFLGHYCPWIPLWFYNTLGPALLIAGVLGIPVHIQRDKNRAARQSLSG